MQLSPVQFEVQTPCVDDVPKHIEHAMSLGLPEADGEPLRRLTIIANGPSAKDAPLDGDTLALNGALKLFFNTGRVPTYWAACDPQRDYVLSFLDVPLSKETIYLVGSKCHPDVFKRLEGFDVRIWHINDYPIPEPGRPVKTASTVTLTAMTLMRRLGYRHFDLWGWDGCYGMDDSHHAVPHDVEFSRESDLTVNVGAQQKGYRRKLKLADYRKWRAMKKLGKQLGLEVPLPQETRTEGGREFKSTRSWALEAQDAVHVLHLADYTVKIYGDGMIKAILAQTGLNIEPG